MLSYRSLPLWIVLLWAVGSACHLGREYDNCVEDNDCPEGEVCYQNGGTKVCIPPEYIPGYVPDSADDSTDDASDVASDTFPDRAPDVGAQCGDGIVDSPGEECDDELDPVDDSCFDTCQDGSEGDICRTASDCSVDAAICGARFTCQDGSAGDACQIAFKGTPDLHTASHEAAHVVQQRAGVDLSNGVGRQGDKYETQANAVADRVVSGKSAEDLLNAGSSATAAREGVQKKAVQFEDSSAVDPVEELRLGAIEKIAEMVSRQPAFSTRPAEEAHLVSQNLAGTFMAAARNTANWAQSEMVANHFVMEQLALYLEENSEYDPTADIVYYALGQIPGVPGRFFSVLSLDAATTKGYADAQEAQDLLAQVNEGLIIQGRTPLVFDLLNQSGADYITSLAAGAIDTGLAFGRIDGITETLAGGTATMLLELLEAQAANPVADTISTLATHADQFHDTYFGAIAAFNAAVTTYTQMSNDMVGVTQRSFEALLAQYMATIEGEPRLFHRDGFATVNYDGRFLNNTSIFTRSGRGDGLEACVHGPLEVAGEPVGDVTLNYLRRVGRSGLVRMGVGAEISVLTREAGTYWTHHNRYPRVYCEHEDPDEPEIRVRLKMLPSGEFVREGPNVDSALASSLAASFSDALGDDSVLASEAERMLWAEFDALSQ